jgi:UDP-glucose 4-epimerase
LPSKILVTGGLGYIGSHTSVELIQQGHDIVIVDDLSNSSDDVLKGIKILLVQHPNFFSLTLETKKRFLRFSIFTQTLRV